MPTKLPLFGPRVSAANTINVGTGVSFTLSSKVNQGGYFYIFGNVAAAAFNAILDVNSSSSPQPVAQSLALGVVSSAYSVTISAAGGTSPYVFSLVSGALPPGLSLNSTTGVISGTPTTPGTYSFTLKVTDTNGSVGNQPFSITVITPSSSGGGSYTFIA
jgi:hypothetical protein